MKIKSIKNVDDFFAAVGTCKGRVELITSEGDRLNLKSKLCQYIALTKLFSEAKIDEIEIVCSEPEDIEKMLNYMLLH